MSRLRFLVIGALFVGGGASAQQTDLISVTVRVTAEGGPIDHALVRLLDNDQSISQRLTDQLGLAVFNVRAGRSYQFAVDRIGYTSWQSKPVKFDQPQHQPVDMVIQTKPISLAEITVEAEERCSNRRPLLVRLTGGLLARRAQQTSAERKRIARVHEQVIAALSAVVTNRPKGSNYMLRVVDEQPKLRNASVQIGSTLDTSFVQQDKVLSAPPVEQLAQHGYISAPESEDKPSVYHALTPEALVSEVFTLTHCFQVVDRPNSVVTGMAFEPLPGSQNYDVRGIVWVDTVSMRPERIEFQYTRLAEYLVDSGEWAAARRQANERDLPGLRGRLNSARRSENARSSRQLNRVSRPAPNEKDYGGTVEFGLVGSHWDIKRWQTRRPGLLSRAMWGGSAPSGQASIDFYVDWSTTVLRYVRTADFVEIIPR